MQHQTLEQIEELLEKRLNELESYETGTEERQAVLNEIERLHKLKIEELKAERDYEFKEKQDSEDHVFKEIQIKEQKLERYFKAGLTVFEVSVPILFYGKWLKEGFKFEEEGVYTSSTFKNLINKFKPTK